MAQDHARAGNMKHYTRRICTMHTCRRPLARAIRATFNFFLFFGAARYDFWEERKIKTVQVCESFGFRKCNSNVNRYVIFVFAFCLI